MRMTIRAMVAVVSALAFSAAAAGASEQLGFEPTTTTLTFPRLEVTTALGFDIACPVTLVLTLNAEVVKSVNAQAGRSEITVGTGECFEGNAGLLVRNRRVTGTQGPYFVSYGSFAGNLPNITAVTLKVNYVEFWVSTSSMDCLTDGYVEIAATTTGGNPATGFRVSDEVAFDNTFTCLFTAGNVTGSGALQEAVTIELED